MPEVYKNSSSHMYLGDGVPETFMKHLHVQFFKEHLSLCIWSWCN